MNPLSGKKNFTVRAKSAGKQNSMISMKIGTRGFSRSLSRNLLSKFGNLKWPTKYSQQNTLNSLKIGTFGIFGVADYESARVI